MPIDPRFNDSILHTGKHNSNSNGRFVFFNSSLNLDQACNEIIAKLGHLIQSDFFVK